jgi:hypothetical protein
VERQERSRRIILKQIIRIWTISEFLTMAGDEPLSLVNNMNGYGLNVQNLILGISKSSYPD